jgi:hypothetical protein
MTTIAITLTLSDHVMEQARHFAQERNITATELLEAALVTYLEGLVDGAEVRPRATDRKREAVPRDIPQAEEG